MWTSGATESDNLAIKGAAHFYQRKGKHIITSKIEHKAVLDTCRQLEREGYEVTYLEPNTDGLTTPEMIADAIREDTTVVSVMHANNEIGVVNDIAGIGAVCRERGVIYHVDAAQSTGKLPLDMEAMQIDLLSISAHKMYGPKGIGALLCPSQAQSSHRSADARWWSRAWYALRHAGNPPDRWFGEAARVAKEEMQSEGDRLLGLRQRFWDAINDIPEVHINGSRDHRLPGALNVSFAFVEGESLIMSLKDLAISSGSACTSASLEPSLCAPRLRFE